MTDVLTVSDLTVVARVGRRHRRREVTLVDGASLSVGPGETVALVGESGAGKTVLASAVMGLLPPGLAVTGGRVSLDGEDLLAASAARVRALRGGVVAMVFQDPLSALHPAFRVGDQIAESLRVHGTCPDRATARARAVELLARVGVPDPARRAREYPHQMSGGMRQRVVIAMAVANEPRLLIADEATTALDVTVQAQVLDVLREAQARTGAGLLLVTHDLGVVAGIADRVVVLYAGRVVEEGPVDRVLTAPAHPYTQGLLRAVPRVTGPVGGRLLAIPGSPPDPGARPAGCAFHPRCGRADERCRVEVPVAVAVAVDEADGVVACHHPGVPA